MNAPISPEPVREWRPDPMPAYVSNGLVGSRVGAVPSKDKGPSPHLTELVSHTVVQVQEGPVGRRVVMLEVPGNQTKPSGVH